jgi:transposase InsO family protein
MSLIRGDNVLYDREFRKTLRESGFHIVNDLVPLYNMANYLKKYEGLPKEAKKRKKWFDYYKKCDNVSKTCRYFGISRKTFYKWYARYEPNNLWKLIDQPTIPHKKRQREITREQEMRVVMLRKRYITYSKIKLSHIYKRTYGETLTSWKIQKVIEKYQLYKNPTKTAQIKKKRLNGIKRKRITEMRKKKKRAGFLLCLDTIEIRYKGMKRYIFTAIDHYSKVAFARMYTKGSSYNASDFINRLYHLLDGRIENIQTDNGSEFMKYFQKSCERFNVSRYFSRPRTPKDNAVNERFNRTLQDEFVSLGNMRSDPTVFNKHLTEWLVEYNFHRPHEALDYDTPINTTNVLPMYPSGTTC